MKRTLLAAAVLLAATACSSSGSSSAKVGDAVNLTGPGGERIAATVQSIVDPATPADGTAPDPGMRLVGVQYQLVNNGSAAYTDTPGTVRLIDAAGKVYAPAQTLPEVISDTAQGATSTGSSIPASESALDVVVFQVPVGVKPAAVQLFMDGGAGKSAKWKVG